jgi:polyribonucleotide nucleotidyltransferase
MAGKDGLLHISEVNHSRLDSLEGVLNVGDEIQVKLMDVDKKTGKFKLSRKALMPKPEAQTSAPSSAQPTENQSN